MLVKLVCLTSASLAVHSNIIEELQKFHEYENYTPIIMCYDTTKNPIGYNNKNSNTYSTAEEQRRTRSHMQHFKNH